MHKTDLERRKKFHKISNFPLHFNHNNLSTDEAKTASPKFAKPVKKHKKKHAKSKASANESCKGSKNHFSMTFQSSAKVRASFFVDDFFSMCFQTTAFAIMKSFCARLWNGENREFMQFSRWLFAAGFLFFCGRPFPSLNRHATPEKDILATCFWGDLSLSLPHSRWLCVCAPSDVD